MRLWLSFHHAMRVYDDARLNNYTFTPVTIIYIVG